MLHTQFQQSVNGTNLVFSFWLQNLHILYRSSCSQNLNVIWLRHFNELLFLLCIALMSVTWNMQTCKIILFTQQYR